MNPSQKNLKNLPFPIAGIGASAGGLEALEQFLGNVPENSGIAFVVIQHLDPTHKGIMTELLQRTTPMKVVQVKDRMRVKPDCVYLIPPNRDMSILHGVLHLFEPAAPRGLRLPLDFFFRSLAEDRRERSIGVILSGMGSDGTLGLRAIKEKGGLVVVQDPATAKFDSMPRCAIGTGLIDVIEPVEELPAKIVSFLQHPAVIATSAGTAEVATRSSLEKILILLREQTGHDFSAYKKNTLYRRIERRMSIHKIEKIVGYVRYLQKNPGERELLFKELLIGVTSFFRDPQEWEVLKNQAISPLIASRPSNYTMRAWVPGCSTGEEAYSLAMIFREAMDNAEGRKNVALQIFATDLDTDAIDKARQGYFSENIAADVTPERLNRFFVREEGGYRVNKETREMVIFASQNIIMDPPFTKLDILSCRNLLIYLTPEMQKKLIPLFHYSLNPDGILFLGNAETIGSFTDLFTPIEGKYRIFRRLLTSLPVRPVEFPASFAAQKVETIKGAVPAAPAINLQVVAEQLILQRFAPSAVLVNDKGDILFISGRTGKYLEPAAGRANWNIFAMAREGLRYRLTSIFQQAVGDRGTATVRGVELKDNGETKSVDLSVEFLNEPESLHGMVMVVFRESPVDQKQGKRKAEKSESPEPARIAELERQLHQLRRELQLTHEEMQTSQEELKATNEELQSTNEELQSTNEELTTSKEELQSLNEELQTVNAEQSSKMEELSRTNSDMKNLLNSTDIATVFLDNDLQVRRFTSGADKIFKLRFGDVGRPLSDITSELVYEDLERDAVEVLRTLVFCEKHVATRNGNWYRVRIMPYRTQEDKIDGLVITFVDVTDAKKVEEELSSCVEGLSSLIDFAPGMIVSLSPEGNVLDFNREAERIFGRNREQSQGRNFFELFMPKACREEVATEMLRALKEGRVGGLETKVVSADGERVIRWSVSRFLDSAGESAGIVAIGIEIT